VSVSEFLRTTEDGSILCVGAGMVSRCFPAQESAENKWCRTIEIARTVFNTPTEDKSETPDAAEAHQ